jgi:membrane protein involved in colicin uptake
MKPHIIVIVLAIAMHNIAFAQEEGSYQYQLAEQKARMELEKLQAAEAAEKRAVEAEAKRKEEAERKAVEEERRKKRECDDQCRSGVRKLYGDNVSENEYRKYCQKCGMF